MIGIQLLGRLGNQMFQYAAARAAAERLGCGFFISGPDFENGWTLQSMAKGLWRSAKSCERVQAEIGSTFPNVAQSTASVAIQIGGEAVRRRVFPRTFAAPRIAGKNGARIEIVDPDYFRIMPRT